MANHDVTVIYQYCEDSLENIKKITGNTKHALDVFIKILSDIFMPLHSQLKLKCNEDKDSQENIDSKNLCENSNEIFSISYYQLSKYIHLLADVFKVELQNGCILQDSRDWINQRIIECLKYIKSSVEYSTDENKLIGHDYLVEGDEFIKWVDTSLETLENFNMQFQDDLERNNSNYSNIDKSWKNECLNVLPSLHYKIREMVSAAMKICQNCLSFDQNIIIARCHVVFREAKKFIEEILVNTEVHMDDVVFTITDIKQKEKLHYPTVRLLNDVLKDVIYNLEASINRAVLGLVLECMIHPTKPMQKILESQCLSSTCKCRTGEVCEKGIKNSDMASAIEEFDIFNERLTQIGFFAVSCSSDKKRISMLKSSLMCLEALDPYLVPMLISNSNTIHSKILTNCWKNEMYSLKILVFLIIDPVAFFDLVLEKYRSQLVNLKNQPILEWHPVQFLINLGQCAFDYVQIYMDHEPNSIQIDKISSFIPDLKKVVDECVAVCKIFLKLQSENLDETNKSKQKFDVTSKEKKQNDTRILKRLKLLYALILNMSKEFSNEELSLSIDDKTDIKENMNGNLNSGFEETKNYKGDMGALNNLIRNIGLKEQTNEKRLICNEEKTCNESRRINQTLSRSTIARINPSVTKSFSLFTKRNPVLSGFFKKHDSVCACNSASFFSENCTHDFLLANISTEDMKTLSNVIIESVSKNNLKSSNRLNLNQHESLRHKRSQRRSLRKQLLVSKLTNNTFIIPSVDTQNDVHNSNSDNKSLTSEFSVLSQDNKTTDWQITDILEQLTSLSNTISLMRVDEEISKMHEKITTEENSQNKNADNIVTLKVNSDEFSSPKKIWNIKINENESNNVSNLPMFDSINCDIDISFGSNIPTPERLNDLNVLEEKLTQLKLFWDK